MYLADLSDADLLVRPVPGANHIAWQLGHLIGAEVELLQAICRARSAPELPAGFAGAARQGDRRRAIRPKGFLTKAEYLDLFNKVREATLAALDKLSDADLDKPTTGDDGQVRPDLGALLLLHGQPHPDARRPVHRRAPQAGQAGAVLTGPSSVAVVRSE